MKLTKTGKDWGVGRFYGNLALTGGEFTSTCPGCKKLVSINSSDYLLDREIGGVAWIYITFHCEPGCGLDWEEEQQIQITIQAKLL